MPTFTTNDLSDLRTLMARSAAERPDLPKPPSRAHQPTTDDTRPTSATPAAPAVPAVAPSVSESGTKVTPKRRPRRPFGAPRDRQLARLKARLTEIVNLAKKVQDASRRITAAQHAKEFFGSFELMQLAGEVDSWRRRICSLLEFDGPDIRAALDRIPPPPMPDATDAKGTE